MPESSMNAKENRRQDRWFWRVFFALTVFTYLFGLSIPLVGPDEPRYAQVAREMFIRGDWVTPTLGGFNWFEKPALLYWFEIAAYNIFGVTEFAARLGPALFGLGTIFCLWLVGRFALGSRFAANWIALIAAATIGIIVFSRGATFDIMVTFPITASLTGFIICDNGEARRPLGLTAFYFFIGVALLAKGLIGIVFPFAIVGFYFLLSRRWPDRRLWISLLWGIPLLAAVAALWYVPMYMRHGYTFIDEFIIQQHFQRFTSNKYQHPQPFYFFFWVLPVMTIPWLPFFLVGTWKAAKSIVLRWLSSSGAMKTSAMSAPESTPIDLLVASSPRLLDSFTRLHAISFSWLIVPLIFFSLSGSKLPGYILPAVPGAVLLAAMSMFRWIDKGKYRPSIIKAAAILMLAFVVIVSIFVVPRFADNESVKRLVATADTQGYGSAQIAGFITVSHNAEFYAAGRLIRDADGKQHRFIGPPELAEYINSHGGRPLLVLSPVEHVHYLTSSEHLSAQIIANNSETAILLVSALNEN
jgi:4-amino-4-deoxy-L-arabinose transferase-like glycosyltransferase